MVPEIESVRNSLNSTPFIYFLYITIGHIEKYTQRKYRANTFECSKAIFPIVTPKRKEPIF